MSDPAAYKAPGTPNDLILTSKRFAYNKFIAGIIHFKQVWNADSAAVYAFMAMDGHQELSFECPEHHPMPKIWQCNYSLLLDPGPSRVPLSE